ncbi:protein O-mannosyl-transferase TMTC2-like [Hetaerina americana]|uniref:protein O-mannosyl-transferase TMTC2-like n=1 Tax=Hetaerina americana TaxID=62018 RepID=UPI003A7F1827
MDAVPRLSSLGDPRNVASLLFYAALLRLAVRSVSRLARPRHCPSQRVTRPYRRPPRTHRVGHRSTQANGSLSLTSSPCLTCKGGSLNYHQRCHSNNNHLIPNGTKHLSSQTLPSGPDSAPCYTCCCPLLVQGTRRLRRSTPVCLGSQDHHAPPAYHHGVSLSLGSPELILISLALLALPFIPASNLFFHVGFVVAERVLYLPSAGYCMLVAIGARAVYSRFVRTRFMQGVLVCGLVVLMVTMGARTVKRNRDWHDEEALYKSGITVNPPKAYGNLGNVLSSQGRTAEAERAYKMALKYRSNMADVHYNLGILLQGRERYEEALQSYRRAIHFRPRLALAHLSLGQTLEKLGRAEEAAESYSRASRLDGAGLRDPEAHAAARASALSHLGRLRADGGRLHEAVALYHQAIRHMPPDYYQAQSLYNMLGEAHYLLREYTEAERWYKAALQVKPDHVPAHLTYGKMLAKNKTRLMEAEQWFLRAKELAPNDSSVFQHFGQFLSELERHVEAAEAWVRAVELAPSEHQMAFNAASALRQAGDNARAEEYYRRAVELSPLDPRSHMNLGAMLHVNGKYREAETAYREALRLRPGDETTLTNLRRLYSLLARLRARANCTSEAQQQQPSTSPEESTAEERPRNDKPEESPSEWSAAAAATAAVPSSGQ